MSHCTEWGGIRRLQTAPRECRILATSRCAARLSGTGFQASQSSSEQAPTIASAIPIVYIRSRARDVIRGSDLSVEQLQQFAEFRGHTFTLMIDKNKAFAVEIWHNDLVEAIDG